MNVNKLTFNQVSIKIKEKMRKFYIFFLTIFLFIVFYAVVIKGMRFYEVPSRSMEPTLYPQDRFVTVKARKIQKGDIIVFEDPTEPSSFNVKRVIALTGDKVEIRNGKLYLNDKVQIEPYVRERIVYLFGPKVVSKDHVFVLGDNRNLSEDSSVWGFLPMENVVGKGVYMYWPLHRRGSIK